jgi:hypothetical protein
MKPLSLLNWWLKSYTDFSLQRFTHKNSTEKSRLGNEYRGVINLFTGELELQWLNRPTPDEATDVSWTTDGLEQEDSTEAVAVKVSGRKLKHSAALRAPEQKQTAAEAGNSSNKNTELESRSRGAVGLGPNPGSARAAGEGNRRSQLVVTVFTLKKKTGRGNGERQPEITSCSARRRAAEGNEIGSGSC